MKSLNELRKEAEVLRAEKEEQERLELTELLERCIKEALAKGLTEVDLFPDDKQEDLVASILESGGYSYAMYPTEFFNIIRVNITLTES